MVNKLIQYQSYPETTTVTTLSGNTDSDVITLYGATLGAVQFPDTLDATAITFKGSADGVNFAPIYDNAGNLITIIPQLSSIVSIPSVNVMWVFRYIKLVSDVAETADRNFTMYVGMI